MGSAKEIGKGSPAGADETLVAAPFGENLCTRDEGADVCEFLPAGRGVPALWIERVWLLEAERSFAAAGIDAVGLGAAPRLHTSWA